MVLLVGLTGAFSTHAATAIAPAIVAVLRTNLRMVFSWTCVERAVAGTPKVCLRFRHPATFREVSVRIHRGHIEVGRKHEHQGSVAYPVRRGCVRLVT